VLITTGPLAHISKTYEEAYEEYLGMFDKHIAEDFRKVPGVEELLKSDLALRRFIPKKWEGLKKAPVELKFKSTLPAKMKPKSRPINPRLYENVKKEFTRMKGYMYEDSTSPIASCLVCAPKATAPFIRLCGDYRQINQHVEMFQAYIPIVQHELNKAQQYKVFLDLDPLNAFHQIILGDSTSNMLSVQTTFGLVKPRFLPEGVSPASGILHSIVSDIFSEFDEWSIVIFDNVLLLANDYDDAYKKLEIFLQKCDEFNVVLKFAKSYLGFSEVQFFGYKVKQGSYELTEDRKDAIMKIPMPKSIKEMQRFLGAALFFRTFLFNYSDLVAPLHDMTKKTFIWTKTSWKLDYESIFQKVKEALVKAVAVFIPDYSLSWILRVDASDKAAGAVLMQLRGVEPTISHEPIGFASHKFSGHAARWDVFKKEAFAVYFGVLKFTYYLRGKSVLIETDHRNLQWIERSEVPMVMRWRSYLQSFDILIKHIPGTRNQVADCLSRNISEEEEAVDLLGMLAAVVQILLEETYYLIL
jgi:putative transposase